MSQNKSFSLVCIYYRYFVAGIGSHQHKVSPQFHLTTLKIQKTVDLAAYAMSVMFGLSSVCRVGDMKAVSLEWIGAVFWPVSMHG